MIYDCYAGSKRIIEVLNSQRSKIEFSVPRLIGRKSVRRTGDTDEVLMHVPPTAQPLAGSSSAHHPGLQLPKYA